MNAAEIALTLEKKDEGVHCDPSFGPDFGYIEGTTRGWTELGITYTFVQLQGHQNCSSPPANSTVCKL
jgi:hypothetical protein